MNKREFFKSVAGASVGLATLGLGAASMAANVQSVGESSIKPRNAAEQRRRERFPNMTLLTHEGEQVRFYDDLIKDKAVFINFMYARCGDICPGMTANLKRLENEFGGRVGREHQRGRAAALAVGRRTRGHGRRHLVVDRQVRALPGVVLAQHGEVEPSIAVPIAGHGDIAHATESELPIAAGCSIPLPIPVRLAMRATATVMKAVAYRL